MIKGPKLSTNQFAVSMAEGATGIALTTKGNIFHNDGSEIYVIFDGLEAARIFIERKQNENDTLEFYIYNSNYEFVEYWEAKKWMR